MGSVAAICTHCGSAIEVDGNEEANICPVCGKAIVTQKAIARLTKQACDSHEAESGAFEIVSGELKRYKGEADEVFVPEGITRLGNSAFAGLNISSVVLPRSLKVIGRQAFKGCERLIRVDMHEGIISIRDRAFDGCKALTSIALPNSLTELGTSCFYGCKSLKEIALPSGLLSLGDCCFYGCGVENLSIPGGLVELTGKAYFAYCDKLKELRFCVGIKKLGQARYASFFQGCTALKSIKLPKGLKYIGNGVFAFFDIAKLTIPSSVTEIGNNAFAHCEQLKELVLPDSVSVIGSEAFQGCTALSSVMLPNKLIRLGYRAFAECSALKYVKLPALRPDNVNEGFPDYLFEDSTIEFLEIPSDFPHGLNNVLENVQRIGTLKAAARDINLLSSCITTRCTAFIITAGKLEYHGLIGANTVICEEGVTSIGDGVFENGELEHIELSNTVTELGNRVFASCFKLAELRIPTSVAVIGRDFISDCIGLKKIIAPLSLKKLLKPHLKKLELSTKRKIATDFF